MVPCHKHWLIRAIISPIVSQSSYIKITLLLCDDLEGWDRGWVGGRLKREGIYVYLKLIHIAAQQKQTQHCKQIQTNFFF